METLGVILGGLLIICIALVPFLLVAKLAAAFFSSKLRLQIRVQWLRHLFLALGAILIVMSAIPGSGSFTRARKVKTESMVNSIQTGIMSYQTEYDVPPEGKDNASLINILTGGNPRGIAFLTMKKSDLDDKGAAVDAWGTPFRIDMTNPNHPKVQSAGPDRKWGTADDMGTVETASVK